MAKDAVAILFDAYWGPEGWRSGRVSAEDKQIAIDAGVMFPSRKLSHLGGVEWAVRSVAATSKEAVVKGFVASLASRRLEFRSALGSYATARHLEPHTFTGGESDNFCDVCERSAKSETENLNVLNFERLKWGGVRHLDPVYAGFDLELFTRLELPEPTEADRALLARVVQTARDLPTGSRARDLEKALKFLKSNKEEREVVVNILGFLGVLAAPEHEGFWRRYVPFVEREEPSASKNDWSYPASWWRGGVDDEAIQDWFEAWL